MTEHFEFEAQVEVSKREFVEAFSRRSWPLLSPFFLVALAIALVLLFLPATRVLGIAAVLGVVGVRLVPLPLQKWAARKHWSRMPWLADPFVVGANQDELWLTASDYKVRFTWESLDYWSELNGWLIFGVRGGMIPVRAQDVGTPALLDSVRRRAWRAARPDLSPLDSPPPR